MDKSIGLEKASFYINSLCEIKGGRRVGSKGNREATGFVASILTWNERCRRIHIGGKQALFQSM